MQGKFKAGDTVYAQGSRRGRIVRLVGPNKYMVKFGGNKEGVFTTAQLYSESEFRSRGGKI